MPNPLKKQSVVESGLWKGRWSRFPNQGETMPEYMYQRGKGKIWYAKRRMIDLAGNKVHIQDSLDTSDERLARRRLAELELAVERGDYHAYKKKFVDAAMEYLEEASRNEEIIIRLHLLPYFKDHTIGGINEGEVFKYFESAKHKPQSTLTKELACLKKVVCRHSRNFVLPKLRYENKGKRFDETQILEESDVLNVIHNYVMEKYRLPCLIAAYSSLRMGNVVNLKRKNVNLKDGWIEVRQTKTGNPVSIPISGKLRDVFRQIKIWPLQDEDKFFPELVGNAMSNAVKWAFRRAGFTWGSYHHFRHFEACFMANNGVRIEVIQKIMGHRDIKSTQIYARLKRETLQEAMKVFDFG